jgi:transposase
MISTRKHRIALLVLIAGGVLAALAFRHFAPSERSVSLRLTRPGSIRAIELVWIDADGDALGATRWSFASRAPSQLHTRVRARDGEYQIRLTVERVDAGTETSNRRVTLSNEGETVLPVD